ncbi:MAG: NRDE family protein [Opitutaceae bacterium]|nr:NRDE family protein [Opitutaceae bacterium]
MSWRRGPGSYDLFFNRDELATRSAELPPRRESREGIEFLAPRDGARGGTWLLVNACGVSLCLLNDYASLWRPRPAVSRGEVVLAGAAATHLGDVAAAVRGQPLSRIASFHLLALAPDAAPLLLHWNGERLFERQNATVMAPLSSSSFATAEVIATRVRRFSAYVRTPAVPEEEELAAYHRQHDPRAGAHSVLMRRPDAATRSLCRISVDATHARLDYERVEWGDGEVRFTPARLELARSGRG